MKKEKQKHEVAMAALARIRCVCGWTYAIDNLKNKTDADLALQCGLEFTRHKKAMER